MEQNIIEINCDNISIHEVIINITELTNKDLTSELIEDKVLISGTIILLNGRNVFHLNKLETIVNNGDSIDIFPPGGGG